MKTPNFYLKAGLLFILPFAILTCGTKVLAQTTDSNLIPVVTVQATQPIATDDQCRHVHCCSGRATRTRR